MMKGIMSAIIHQISEKNTGFEENIDGIVLNSDPWIENTINQEYEGYCEQNWWINQSIGIVW